MLSSIFFTVALVQNQLGLNKLEQIVLDISNPTSTNYGNYLSNAEIGKLVAPDASVQTHVFDYLTQQGFSCQLTEIGDAIGCQGPRYLAEKVFLINPEWTHHNIPSEIAADIDFIDGLTNRVPTKFVEARNSSVTGGNPYPDPGYVGREVLENLYGLPKGFQAGDISIAAVEYQGSSGYSNLDLVISQYENGEKLNPVNLTLGPNGYPDTETELDLQMISQAAEGSKIWYIGGTQWLYTLIVKVLNSTQVPDVMSMSWGWSADQMCTISKTGPCSNGDSQLYVSRVDSEYMKAGARGITILVSSGDAGAPGRTNEQCTNATSQSGRIREVNAAYPGSSPWVTSVGALYVVQDSTHPEWNFHSNLCKVNNCTTGTQQAQVNQASVGWTAGGGTTYYQSTPVWQQSLVTEYLESGTPFPRHFNKTGRFYPDVVALGHNCPTWQNGGLAAVDGTSCSSPMFAGFVGVLNQQRITQGKSKLGFLNPLLYHLYATTRGTNRSVFTDVMEGNNWCTEYMCCPMRQDGGSDFGYLASKGFDAVAGLGIMNVTRALEQI